MYSPPRADGAAEDVDEQQQEDHRERQRRDRARPGCAACGACRGARTRPRRRHRRRLGSTRATVMPRPSADRPVGADEDVVERWARGRRRGRRSMPWAASWSRTSRMWSAEPSVGTWIESRPPAVAVEQPASAARDHGRVRRSSSSRTSVPTRALSSAAVPSATRRPPSSTPMRSASSSASSRYCVVSRIVVPAGGELLDAPPQRLPAARVEAGRRLVEEQHGRDDDQAGGEVEAAAHPARVRTGAAVGGVEQVEPGEQLVGPARGRRAGGGRRCGRPCARFSRPVSSSSTAVAWPVTLIARRTASGRRRRRGRRRSPRRCRPASAW